MNGKTVALFGEAEKGTFGAAYLCDSLLELMECAGNPPPDSRGLFYAVQAILYNHSLIFFRVEEEGFSRDDYLSGIHLLEAEGKMPPISALCLPGVGDRSIINAATPFCLTHNSILIMTAKDLYDYLTG